jgi:hypothetical protein
VALLNRSHRPTRPVTVALTFAAALAGCVPGDGPAGNFDAQDLGADDGGPSDLGGDRAAERVPSADGVWLHYAQNQTCVDVLATANFETYNRSYYIVTVEQDAFGILSESWENCQIELSPLLGLQPQVLPGLLDDLYPVVTGGGLINSTNIGEGYASGMVAEPWGIRFDDPVNDEFPTSADDPRIEDTDGDGNPGATLDFDEGSCLAFVAQRTSTLYRGEFVEFDRIEGSSVSTNRQLVLGSTGLCGTQYQVRTITDRNVFTRLRIDGQGGALDLDANEDGQITCSEVLPFKDVLFERVETNDCYCQLRPTRLCQEFLAGEEGGDGETEASTNGE